MHYRPLWLVIMTDCRADAGIPAQVMMAGAFTGPAMAKEWAKTLSSDQMSVAYIVFARRPGDYMPSVCAQFEGRWRLPNDDEIAWLANEELVKRIERTSWAFWAYLDTLG